MGRPDTLSIITRHSGPSSTYTSATALCGHITNTVVPRVAPVLNRKRAEIQSRNYERQLREDQDRAFAESQARDYERIMKRREEERQRQREEQKIELEAAERIRRRGERMQWRRYARQALIPPEPTSKTSLRIGVRLPTGKQIIRKFDPTDSITGLYAFVDSLLIPPEFSPEHDPTTPPGEEETYDWDWDFRLSVVLPRAPLPWTFGNNQKLGDVPALKGGANLILEMRSDATATDLETASEDEDSD